MNFSMFLTETTAGAAKSGPGSLIMTLVMVAVLGAAMYFFMYLPQKKQDKKNNEMKNSLSVGDEVTTIGGIVGRVISIRMTASSSKQQRTEQKSVSCAVLSAP